MRGSKERKIPPRENGGAEKKAGGNRPFEERRREVLFQRHTCAETCVKRRSLARVVDLSRRKKKEPRKKENGYFGQCIDHEQSIRYKGREQTGHVIVVVFYFFPSPFKLPLLGAITTHNLAVSRDS